VSGRGSCVVDVVHDFRVVLLLFCASLSGSLFGRLFGFRTSLVWITHIQSGIVYGAQGRSNEMDDAAKKKTALANMLVS
jgi:hypothetical protein